jgi:hypothetical protein
MIATGALGRLSDRNLMETATITAPGGGWDAGLPVANLADRAWIARPARCVAPGNPALARFDATLDRQRAVSVVALLFHTLSSVAQWRVSGAPAAGDLNAPTWTSGWRPAHPRWSASASLPWEDPNWWTGSPAGADLDLFPRHAIWTAPAGAAPPLAAKVRVEISDGAAAFVDMGGAWIGSGWQALANHERGRQLGLLARDVVEEAPSGRFFADERAPRRTLALRWDGLSDADARRLFDAGARVRGSGALLFVPDAGDAAALAREAFPATWAERPAPVFNFDGANAARAVIQEIVS